MCIEKRFCMTLFFTIFQEAMLDEVWIWSLIQIIAMICHWKSKMKNVGGYVEDAEVYVRGVCNCIELKNISQFAPIVLWQPFYEAA